MTDPLATPDSAAPHARPGWYDDGSGRHRWWTGTNWSEHYSDGLGPAGALPLSTRCPTCASLDRVQTVGIILQTGTSPTLAPRFSPPPRPRPPVWRWALWLTLGGLIVALIWGGNASGSLLVAVLTGIFLLVPLFLVACGFAAITALVARPHYRRLQADWGLKSAAYYRYLYCFRDDTMFTSGSLAQRPEDVKARVFWG